MKYVIRWNFIFILTVVVIIFTIKDPDIRGICFCISFWLSYVCEHLNEISDNLKK